MKVSTGSKVCEERMLPNLSLIHICSGGNYALAAARALAQNTDFSAEEIARKSLKIASEICVFTNDHIICETV